MVVSEGLSGRYVHSMYFPFAGAQSRPRVRGAFSAVVRGACLNAVKRKSWGTRCVSASKLGVGKDGACFHTLSGCR